VLCCWLQRLTMATKGSSVASSLKLSNVDLGFTWMGDRQGKSSPVNLCPFVGVNHNLSPSSI